jgi:phosphoribosylamine--glycine ligase/phosphoribosylformylglycinamidine cyclo-ligase
MIHWLIHSADLPGSLNFFHAGTSLLGDGSLVTSGGRVMAVSATADSLSEAVKLAYTGASMVNFEGMFYRRDIAHRLVLQKFTQGERCLRPF